jgi:EAL domain-containing protein (putative c-di-GMP-specific phosphodiesterase class I)
LHFSLKALIETVHEALTESGLDSSSLQLELTEGVLMQDTKTTMDIMASLDQMGVRWFRYSKLAHFAHLIWPTC